MAKLPPLIEMARDMAAGSDPERTGLKPHELLGVRRANFLAVMEAAQALPTSAELKDALDELVEVETISSNLDVPSGALGVICKAVHDAEAAKEAAAPTV